MKILYVFKCPNHPEGGFIYDLQRVNCPKCKEFHEGTPLPKPVLEPEDELTQEEITQKLVKAWEDLDLTYFALKELFGENGVSLVKARIASEKAKQEAAKKK